jgi:hypothetical protein
MIERSCFRKLFKLSRTPLSSSSQNRFKTRRLLIHSASVTATLERANRRIFDPEQASLLPVPITVIHRDGAVEASTESSEYSAIRMETDEIGLEEAGYCYLDTQ